MSLHTSLFIAVLVIIALFDSEALKETTEPVTCGSVVKLIHKDTGNNLHSHGIAWGSGSGQQSVTTNSAKTDKGSLWVVKESSKASEVCEIGTPVKCGDIIRLEHADTTKNLHSHLFKAPVSGNQEVSGFGDEHGNGDSGDNWQVVCESGQGLWYRYVPVHFRHADTNRYLVTSGRHVFNQQNCGHQCPIMGQTEVSAGGSKTSAGKWLTDQGVYFPSKFDTDSGNEL
eukprot:CAMPEP_0181288322 /NCGR_PEP_ID=MMETSP1101-20121128/270_1 /TAXON_ID=46948 /ORGANISM="Rhodomonas abbreviata, Strain Caron Lab Isolate" /LENGTH=227 /DNA_ID=CAMNT_0023392435 /DNA_START=31 /DNA_END=714 /DNA_ORIENTATION=-